MRVEVFKKTTDDWYPPYRLAGWCKGAEEQHLVLVSFVQTGPKPPVEGLWRVCAWGQDDCGMEKDFEKEAEAWVCFLEVIGLEDVTLAALQLRGFVSA